VIAVGNLLTRKGYDILIRAIAHVVQRNKAAHLLLVGRGPDEIPLQKLANQLGITSAVTFVGAVSRSELPAFLRSAEVFCHPARYDTFPLAPLEAMACGLPALVSSTGALPEIVGDAGLVHATGDEGALSRDLIDVLGTAQLRNRLGTLGRSRVVEHFTWQVMCDSYIDLYRRLAQKRTVSVG
jgi:glycosyltransferase involved in cell wall biosynthesis